MKNTCVWFMVVALLVAMKAMACFWDIDTLAMEQRQFPKLLELMTGHLPIHSKEYYEWIVADRKQRLDQDPKDLSAMDDLAVAYDKLGNPEKGIEVMLAKENLEPGQYTTAANLGTLYIHTRELEKGLLWIRKAIEINPDAHFGREIVQQRLVEYVLLQRKEGVKGLPLDREIDPYPKEKGIGFAAYYLRAQIGDVNKVTPELRQKLLNDAGRGISGMMHFGNWDSPVLQEAMGDILISSHRNNQKGARNHASLAYLGAALRVDDPTGKAILREKAGAALAQQGVVGDQKSFGPDGMKKLPVLDKELELLSKYSARYREKLHDLEREWIREGKQLDDEFHKLLKDPNSFLNTSGL